MRAETSLGAPEIDFSQKENSGYLWPDLYDLPEVNAFRWRDVNLRVKFGRVFDAVRMDSHMIVSERFKEILEKKSGDDCLFHRLCINDEPFYLLIVQRIVDCLDRSKSDLRWFAGNQRIRAARNYAFHSKQLSAAIFRIPENRVPIFVAGEVACEIKGSKIQGVTFLDAENPAPGEHLP